MIYLVNVFNYFFSHHALNCCEAAEIVSTRIPDTFSLCVDISTAVKKAQQWQHFLVYFYRPSIICVPEHNCLRSCVHCHCTLCQQSLSHHQSRSFVHSSLCYTSLKTSSHRFFFGLFVFSPDRNTWPDWTIFSVINY